MATVCLSLKMQIFPTKSPFGFGNFVIALRSASPGIIAGRSPDLLLQTIWSGGFDISGPNGEVTEAYIMHGMLGHPDPKATVKDFSPQPHPICRRDLMLALYRIKGLPRAPVIIDYVRALNQSENPPSAHALFRPDEVYSALQAISMQDYPPAGRNMLARVILPYRRLREFCRKYDYIEPEVLTRRLAGLPIDDRTVKAPEPPSEGRPKKHRDRYDSKFRERVVVNAVMGEAMAEARWLRSWLMDSLINDGLPTGESDLPKEATIRNHLLRIYDFKSRTLKTA
jgi:hypothetical protein